MNSNVKVSLGEKLSYGAGEFASSMFWKLFAMFLMFFYTDIFGISAVAVGTMFLVTRLWDVATDPMMGILGDRTKSRWGKFRPYLLFVSVPFAIAGIMTFTTPDLDPTGKVIYAYVTYTTMMMVYTAINVPYASLMVAMTSNAGERTTLATWRLIGAFSGGLFVAMTANWLVNFFGENELGELNNKVGYQGTVAVFAGLSVFLYITTFLGTRERLAPIQEKNNSLKNDLKDLAANGPWFILLGAAIFNAIFNALRDGTILYYFKYHIKDQSLHLFGESYEFTQTGLASTYMSVWVGTNIIGVLLAKPLSKLIGKKRTFMYSIVISSALSFAFFLVEPQQLLLIFGLNILIGISAGVTLPLIWAMFADISDFSEWKNGRRSIGLILSSSSMSQKFGFTLGGALSGWILAWIGFEANVDQSESTILGLRLMISVFAGIAGLIAAVLVYLYKLDEPIMEKIQNELKEIRQEN